MFRIERLQALHAVQRHGSLAAAADALHLTPSAVSQQLSKLEQEAGTTLLVPSGRGVRLTAAGNLLADSAGTVLDELASARLRLDALAGSVTGPVTVGTVPSGVHAFVTEALTSLRAECPGVVPGVIETEPEQALPMLATGQLDIAVVESWENMPLSRPPHTSWRHLCHDTASIALPAGDERATTGQIQAETLADVEWVAWSEGSRAHMWLCHTLRERGIEPDVRHRVTGYATQFAVVSHLGAAALVPTLALAAAAGMDISSARLHPPLRRSLYAVTTARTLRPAVAACLERLVCSAPRANPEFV